MKEEAEVEFEMPASYLVQEGNGIEMLSRIEMKEFIAELDKKKGQVK